MQDSSRLLTPAAGPLPCTTGDNVDGPLTLQLLTLYADVARTHTACTVTPYCWYSCHAIASSEHRPSHASGREQASLFNTAYRHAAVLGHHHQHCTQRVNTVTRLDMTGNTMMDPASNAASSVLYVCSSRAFTQWLLASFGIQTALVAAIGLHAPFIMIVSQRQLNTCPLPVALCPHNIAGERL
jgi:hypothetical protein